MMKHKCKRHRCWQSSGAPWSAFMEKAGYRWSYPGPARCFSSNCEHTSPSGSASRWSRGSSLLRALTAGHKLSSRRGGGPWWRPRASCAWIKQLLLAGLSSPVGLVFYVLTNPLRGKLSFVSGLNILKFV